MRRHARVPILVATAFFLLALSQPSSAFPDDGCPNQLIRQAQHTTYLGECRAMEMVNNPDRGNQVAQAKGFPNLPPMTPDGQRVLWTVEGGAPGSPNGNGATFLAERGPAGWQSRSVPPEASQQIGGGEYSYLPDTATPGFSRMIFRVARSAPIEGVVGEVSLLRLDDQQHQEVVHTYPHLGTGGLGGAGIDPTNDGAHLVLINQQTHQLEDVGSGASEVLSLMPDGTESSCGLFGEGASFIGGGSTTVGPSKQWRPGYHLIATTDASRVYFQTRENGDCSGNWGIYERNREANTTTLIDPGANGHSPSLIRVTPNGRAAYFVTYSQLDPADSNAGGDIYRWDEATGESTCLTCAVSSAVNLSEYNGALDPVMVSDDFSHIYFQTTEQLISGKGTPGKPMLYLLSGGSLKFVTELEYSEGSLAYFPERAALTPNGDVLALVTRGGPALTADALASECPPFDSHESTSCEELYRYDDRDGSVICLSCRPGGVTTHSVGSPGLTETGDFRLSGDGETVAFVTSEALLARDINLDTDIYEWRSGSHHLLTNGVSSFQSGIAAPQVRGISADGSNILIAVAEPGVTGFEQDGLPYLYDARVGGGFTPPTQPAHCIEDSCQGPLVPAPATSTPTSSSFRGLGVQKRSLKKKARCARQRGKTKQRCRRKRRGSRQRGHRHLQMAARPQQQGDGGAK
jgi:hypothetical protein